MFPSLAAAAAQPTVVRPKLVKKQPKQKQTPKQRSAGKAQSLQEFWKEGSGSGSDGSSADCPATGN